MFNKFLAAIFFLFLTFTVYAQDHIGCTNEKKSSSCCSDTKGKTTSETDIKAEQHQVSGLKQEVSTETAGLKTWNAVCPVMGYEIDPEVRSIKYGDKVYGFCCDGCDDKFLKEPEKYSKNLSEDGKKFVGEK